MCGSDVYVTETIDRYLGLCLGVELLSRIDGNELTKLYICRDTCRHRSHRVHYQPPSCLHLLWR